MRTYLSEYTCLAPATVAEALEIAANEEVTIPIAGGTDVMVWMNDGKLPRGTYLSLHKLASEWRHVTPLQSGALRIGALATYSDVRHHPAVAELWPLLREAAIQTAAIQIQNRGTIVGNIANGSPAADTVPVLLAYDANVQILSRDGERTVPLSEFYTGYRKNVLRRGELIASVELPPHDIPAKRQWFLKAGTRMAQAISKVVFAGVRHGAHVRMAWGSVAPVTLRSVKTEAAIAGGANADTAWEILRTEVAPIDDIRSTREYRTAVVHNILREFLKRTA